MPTIIIYFRRRPRRRKHQPTPIDHEAARRELRERYVHRLRNRIRGSRWFLAQMRNTVAAPRESTGN